MNPAAALLKAPRADADHLLDDWTIARRIATGDRAAFERLMRRNNRPLYRLARAALRDDSEAEDALQEAYFSAYRSIGQFRGESSLSTWLSRMVLNECFARLRKRMRRQNALPIASSDALDAFPADHRDCPDQLVGRAEMRTLIESKLDELPEEFRTVFVLRAVEEFSVEETAACLGIPEATVRSRHFRARSLLRESLALSIDASEGGLYEFGGVRCDRIVTAVCARLVREERSARPPLGGAVAAPLATAT